jgi:hypothetical protein
MLHGMAMLLGPIKPDLARQARAALVMDAADLTFSSDDVRNRYPNVPTTRLSDVLVSTPQTVEQP